MFLMLMEINNIFKLLLKNLFHHHYLINVFYYKIKLIIMDHVIIFLIN